MITTSSGTHHKMSKTARAALIVSVVDSALLWAATISVSASPLYHAIFDHLPAFISSWIGLLFFVAPVAVIVAIVLNLLAGRAGGIDRRIGVFSGLVLMSPAAYLLVLFAIGLAVVGQ